MTLNTIAHHNSLEPTLLLHRFILIIIYVVSAFIMFMSNLVKFCRFDAILIRVTLLLSNTDSIIIRLQIRNSDLWQPINLLLKRGV